MDKVKEVLSKYHNEKENLVQIMLEVQKLSEKNYLPDEWVRYVAEALDLPLSKVYGVITFYAMFNNKPRGKNLIEVCKSGPCHVNGSANIIAMLEKELGIKPSETTSDGLFTIELSNCFGACDIAPAVKIGEKVYGNLTQDSIKNIINPYREGFN
ncbi:MAG: NAD(P)H-dependent oxidoreductase subunit E [Eubacteriales bacterium]